MKRFLSPLILSLCFILSACVPIDDKTPGNNDDTDPNDDGNDVTTEYTLQDFFNLDNVLAIEIIISDDELQKINDDNDYYSNFGSKSPIYRMCDVKITLNEEQYELNEVGIRMKGNTSRRDFFRKEEGIYNLVHFKLSFQETFDDEQDYDNPKVWTDQTAREKRKNRTFFGLENLDLKWNKNYDATHVKQIYTYEKFRENGLLAPHATLATLKMKGKSLGVYEVLEPIDKGFIERYLPEKDWGGDLYKVGWNHYKGGDLTPLRHPEEIGIENEKLAYFPNYDLKTNKKTSQHLNMINLLDRLNNTSLQQLDSVVAEIFDMNYWTMFEAVSYMVGNPDDLRNHYNNYYLYFLGSNNKAIIIPYDYDRVLGITYEWNPSSTGMTSIEPNSLSNTMQNGTQQINPLYKNVILKTTSIWNKEYLKRIEEIYASNQFTLSDFLPYFEKAKNHYQNDVIPEIDRIRSYYIDFAITESIDINRTDTNLSVERYFSLKRETVARSLNK